MDYLKLYETNQNFNSYVNKYCVKHDIDVKDAIQHVIVKAYGDQIASAPARSVATAEAVAVGCGGC